MEERALQLAVPEVGSVSALVSAPEVTSEHAAGVVLAHGAGADMHHVLLSEFAAGVAACGHPVLRFNFPYKEKGRKAPDRPRVLAATWQAAWQAAGAQPEFRDLPRVAAGKSMGGRIASQLVAEASLPAHALLLLGYPLHPAGKKDRRRDEHFPQLRVPCLFFAGTRDPLCDLALLRTALGRLGSTHELEVIDGGDHSFKVPKSSGVEAAAVMRRLVECSVRWLEAVATARA